MIVAGIGCRAAVRPEAVQAAIAAALRQTGRSASEVTLMATTAAKAAEPGLAAAARALGLRVVALPEAALLAAAPGCLTNSPRARTATGLPSVAEAAALAAAGAGGRLLAPRTASSTATCALAEVAS